MEREFRLEEDRFLLGNQFGQRQYADHLPGLDLGIALKIDDGARRAAEAVMMRLLQNFHVLTERAKGRLLNLLEPPVFNRVGKVVGVERIADGSGL